MGVGYSPSERQWTASCNSSPGTFRQFRPRATLEKRLTSPDFDERARTSASLTELGHGFPAIPTMTPDVLSPAFPVPLVGFQPQGASTCNFRPAHGATLSPRTWGHPTAVG